MNAVLSNVMNPAQMMIINSFASATSQKELDELRDLLLDYYNQKLQEELQRLWADGTLDQKRLDELKEEHFRTTISRPMIERIVIDSNALIH